MSHLLTVRVTDYDLDKIATVRVNMMNNLSRDIQKRRALSVLSKTDVVKGAVRLAALETRREDYCNSLWWTLRMAGTAIPFKPTLPLEDVEDIDLIPGFMEGWAAMDGKPTS